MKSYTVTAAKTIYFTAEIEAVSKSDAEEQADAMIEDLNQSETLQADLVVSATWDLDDSADFALFDGFDGEDENEEEDEDEDQEEDEDDQDEDGEE